MQFTANSTPEEVAIWKEMEHTAQEARVRNPEAMDIYDINPGHAIATQTQGARKDNIQRNILKIC